MLGKLIKFDFKANIRKIIPLLGAFLLCSILLKIFTQIDFTAGTTGIAILFACILIAICIIYITSVLQHYNRSMYGSEGYLMHTLPVTSRQLLLSKVISAFLVGVVCLLTSSLSALINMDLGSIQNLQAATDFFVSFTFNEFVQLLVVSISFTFLVITTIFLSCSVSAIPVVKNHRVGTLTGLVGYFIFNYIIIRLGTAILNPVMGNASGIMAVVALSGYMLVMGLGCFFATTFLIDRYKTL